MEAPMRNSLLLALLVLSGCATTGTKGVVEIGPDLYMLGGLGGPSDLSGSAVKARLFEEGSKYCKERGRVMSAVNSSAKDSMPYAYASAEVQFRCLPPNEPRLAK